MNIFILDYNFKKNATYHVNAHVSKLVLETAQLLCTVAKLKGFDAPYKPTHVKHPAVLWLNQSSANWNWLCLHGLALAQEYTFRYGKIHKCEAVIKGLQNRTLEIWKDNKPYFEHTPFVKCMPDHYKVDDPVQSYRNYYKGDKAYIAQWTKRPIPDWWLL